MENAADILDNLPMEPAPKRQLTAGFAEYEQLYDPNDAGSAPDARDEVLALLSPEPTAVDDLVRHCHLSPSVTMAVLLELELAGRVETLAGSRVALLPDT